MAVINDLTQGKPSRVIWTFSLPLLLSTALQQIYNIADSMIVGWLVGEGGLAAIGAAYPITLFFIAVATGSSMGCSVVIAQLFGSKRLSDMKSAIFTAIFSLCILGIVLAGAGVLLSVPLMRWLNASDDILGSASAYLAIYSVGVLPMFVYNTGNAIFTGLGDSKRPLYFLFFSSVLNIILDLIAVGPMNCGVIGAAWATTISQAVASFLCTFVLVRRIRSVDCGPYRLFDRAMLADMCRIALPSIFQQSCIALGHTFVQSLVNSFGTAVVAGYEVASKIHNFAYMCFNTIGTALSSFVAQNYGAKKIRRVVDGYRISSLICFSFTLVVLLLMQLIPAQLIGLFIDGKSNPAVIQVGVNYLRIISPVYLVICFIITSGGLLRGLGRVRDFFAVTVLDLFIRVSLSFVLSSTALGYTGLFWAWYFGSVTDVVICLFLYRRMRTKGQLRDDLDRSDP